MQNPFHASYWTQTDQFSARNHQRAPIHPTQSSLSWAIKKINKILRLYSCHGSNSPNFVRFLISSRWWKLSPGLIVKTSCKNSILSEQNKERNQNSETSNFAFALRIISTGKCCKCYRKPMQKYYFKEPELYLCSFPSQVYFLAWDKRLFLLLIKTDHEINPRTSVCHVTSGGGTDGRLIINWHIEHRYPLMWFIQSLFLNLHILFIYDRVSPHK